MNALRHSFGRINARRPEAGPVTESIPLAQARVSPSHTELLREGLKHTDTFRAFGGSLLPFEVLGEHSAHINGIQCEPRIRVPAPGGAERARLWLDGLGGLPDYRGQLLCRRQVPGLAYDARSFEVGIRQQAALSITVEVEWLASIGGGQAIAGHRAHAWHAGLLAPGKQYSVVFLRVSVHLEKCGSLWETVCVAFSGPVAGVSLRGKGCYRPSGNQNHGDAQAHRSACTGCMRMLHESIVPCRVFIPGLILLQTLSSSKRTIKPGVCVAGCLETDARQPVAFMLPPLQDISRKGQKAALGRRITESGRAPVWCKLCKQLHSNSLREPFCAFCSVSRRHRRVASGRAICYSLICAYLKAPELFV